MYRIFAFLASGLISFLLVGTVVAQQLASSSINVKPAISERTMPAAVRHMSGTIKEIDLAAHTLSLKSRRGEQSFMINSETQVKRGRTHLRLDGLRSDSQATVTYLELDGKKQARIIKLKK